MKTLKFHSSHPSGGQYLTLIQDPEGRVNENTIVVSEGNPTKEGDYYVFVSDDDVKIMLSRSLTAEMIKSELSRKKKDIYLDGVSGKVLIKYQAHTGLPQRV